MSRADRTVSGLRIQWTRKGGGAHAGKMVRERGGRKVCKGERVEQREEWKDERRDRRGECEGLVVGNEVRA